MQKLSEIVNLDKMRALPAEGVEQLWKLHFSAKPRMLASAMQAQDYSDLAARAQDSPLVCVVK